MNLHLLAMAVFLWSQTAAICFRCLCQTLSASTKNQPQWLAASTSGSESLALTPPFSSPGPTFPLSSLPALDHSISK
jgi:hypothetical protein